MMETMYVWILLHWGCYDGYDEVLAILLQDSKENGIDFNAKNKYSYTGFICACLKNHPKIVKILLEESSKKKIHLNGIDINMRTGVHIACYCGCDEIVEILRCSLSNFWDVDNSFSRIFLFIKKLDNIWNNQS